eukprot:188153-Prorocentrum_minimum.AAC.1
MPLDVLERHDLKCVCADCKAGISKGKSKAKAPREGAKGKKAAAAPAAEEKELANARKRLAAAQRKLDPACTCHLCKE